MRNCVSKLWTLERPQVGGVRTLCQTPLVRRSCVRSTRPPSPLRAFFLSSFLLSFLLFLCGVPFARACLVVFCACVRNALLCVACCARSPGRVLRLRCEGGIGGAIRALVPALQGAIRALVPALHFALVITKFFTYPVSPTCTTQSSLLDES